MSAKTSQGKKKADRRKTRVSTRDMRMLLEITSQNKKEAHHEEVKEMDKELKNLSGENRRTPNNSIRSSDSARQSLGSITSEQNITILQFMQDRSAMVNSVKERLRKIQNTKKEKSEKRGKEKEGKKKRYLMEYWDDMGINRNSLGKNWNKLNPYRSKIVEHSGSYPGTFVETLTSGQEHPKRFVECYCCGKYINSMEKMEMMENGLCLHENCLVTMIEE